MANKKKPRTSTTITGPIVYQLDRRSRLRNHMGLDFVGCMAKRARLISSAGGMDVNEALVVANIQGLRVGTPSRFRHVRLT